MTELYEKSRILRDILNEKYEKGNKLFADFEITGQIIYTNHNLNLYPENKNPELAHLLCEMTNHHIPSHETFLNWNGRGDKDLEEVLFLGKDLKTGILKYSELFLRKYQLIITCIRCSWMGIPIIWETF